MAKTKANRDRGEIIALILEAATAPATRSKLMYGAMLNFRQITDYLPPIIDAGLLRHYEDNTYVISEKGRRYLELYSKRSALLHNVL
jgi:predicted transcriptional regulator